MSLRQDLLIKNLPKNGFNIAKTAREVGYTEQGSRSGTLYASLRDKIAKAYLPETLKAKIEKAGKWMQKADDRNNYCRILELQAKIAGLLKENPDVNVNIVTETIEQLFAQRQVSASASATTESSTIS